MTLVSWYGANAYSLWANQRNWRRYRADADLPAGSFLPTEAQWEYAARGTRSVAYPWGDAAPTPERMRYAMHRPTTSYELAELPFAEVQAELGMSPFGLHHMAGNVWQWCRDRYADDFYRTPKATARNAANLSQGEIRSERGGSWVGPARLCRSSYRRGRNPEARGRCLGFRCVSDAAAVPRG
jgi:sulfatase modifying factor 1